MGATGQREPGSVEKHCGKLLDVRLPGLKRLEPGSGSPQIRAACPSRHPCDQDQDPG